jgi:hypothetical protein
MAEEDREPTLGQVALYILGGMAFLGGTAGAMCLLDWLFDLSPGFWTGFLWGLVSAAIAGTVIHDHLRQQWRRDRARYDEIGRLMEKPRDPGTPPPRR